jgi:hypothetical protein
MVCLLPIMNHNLNSASREGLVAIFLLGHEMICNKIRSILILLYPHRVVMELMVAVRELEVSLLLINKKFKRMSQ